jgi:hypothetical protein
MYDTPADLVIDVMVVYTPAALAYEGSVMAMNNNIALALQKANEAHGNSDTRVALNLVYSAEVPYTEAETLDPVYGWPGDDLDNLTFTGGVNSAMDEVLIWRDEYKADLVCLFEKTDIVGGLAWLLNTTGGSPDQGFCLARVQQSDWTYTVVHEWGHNMGCSHSKGQSSGPWDPGDLFSYSAGWQWSDSESTASIGYCSVMTYEDFDDVGPPYSDEYERVPHFSNPDISYTGNSVNATGDVVDGDNARAIRNTRQAVSEYRIRDENFMLYPFASETNTWFQWQTVESSLYSLYWSDYLPSGFSLMASNLTSGVYTDTLHSAEQTGFYKLEPQTIP